ncbi:unnamed protein product [Polarella glacialis]|uniref:Amine oxidase domain-containing protein n=1 Tax=Polarella glacialis TaxID=89957 RepID=A0A813FQB6_POLGL|nr:unnamed protein product [Polarella glacialis]
MAVRGSSQPRHVDVLVVGGGCSGGLAASLLREGFDRRGADGSSTMSLHVWEWARGPAGRMSTFWWEDEEGRRHVADLGAQVFSTPDAGEAEQLRQLGAVDATGLALTTPERPPHWTHLWAPGGMTELLRRRLEVARADDVAFGRRVTGIWLDGGCWHVEARGDSGGNGRVRKHFDVVVFAGTASDIINIEGFRGAVGSDNAAALDRVRYDHRLAVALMLAPQLEEKMQTVFGIDNAELDLEKEGAVLGLLSWQDRKHRQHASRTVLVAHSTCRFAASNLQRAKDLRRHPKEVGFEGIVGALAERLEMSVGELRRSILDSKVVHWRQCQMQRRVQLPGFCLEVLPVASGGPLLVACGDYFAEGNYHGCVKSATAAASAVLSWTGRTVAPAAASAGYPGSAKIDPSSRPARRWNSAADTSTRTEDLVKVEAATASQGTTSRGSEAQAPRPKARWQRKS